MCVRFVKRFRKIRKLFCKKPVRLGIFFPEILKFDAQPVCNAIHIGIIRRDLINIQNSAVIISRFPQRNQIFRTHFARGCSELRSIIQHSSLCRSDIRFFIIVFYLFHQLVILCGSEESLLMMRDSVMTLI